MASSSGLTATVPRASAGEVSIGDSMPACRATSATRARPMSDAICTVGTFLDRTSASRMVTSPSYSSPKFFGSHTRRRSSRTWIGWSATCSDNIRPAPSAAAYTNGLNALPVWRLPPTTRSKRECRKSRPPTQARTSPVCASRATTAPCRYA